MYWETGVAMFGSIWRLYHGLRTAIREPAVRGALLLVATLILIATVFYWVFEGWSLLDSVYFSVVTIATVGYGDLAPKTAIGKIFTMGYIFAGIGIFVATAAALAHAVMRDGQSGE
jgi:voltage-gated potassium channel